MLKDTAEYERGISSAKLIAIFRDSLLGVSATTTAENSGG
jgi:hypothetical protein